MNDTISHKFWEYLNGAELTGPNIDVPTPESYGLVLPTDGTHLGGLNEFFQVLGVTHLLLFPFVV